MDPFCIWSICYPDSGSRGLFFISQVHTIWDVLINVLLKRYAGTLAVDKKSKGLVVEQAVTKLARGDIVAITPEGIITRSTTLRKGKTGTARMALLARACVVPVGIQTDYYVWHVQHLIKWLIRPKNKAVIAIGNALRFDHHYGEPISERLLVEVTADIIQEIGKLCGKEYNPEKEVTKCADTE